MRLTATVMERSAWTILLGALSIFTTTHLKWTTRSQVDNAMFSVVRDGYEKNEIGDFRSILAQRWVIAWAVLLFRSQMNSVAHPL